MMTDEGPERDEGYRDLNQYIEALQAGHPAPLPAHIMPEQRRIYRMAALFCAASSDTVEPSIAFANALYTRLLTMEQKHS